MSKRKLRFNAVDVLIILLFASVAFVLLYIFVLSDRGTETTGASSAKIQYVVEVQNIDSRFAESVKRDQIVEDAITRKNIGKVIGVESRDFEKITFDYDNAREVSSLVEGRISLRITIEADAAESDRAFTVNGVEIRVGKQFSLILPDLYGVGFCIELKKQ